jgi:uroporphyrinogen decarboxylase
VTTTPPFLAACARQQPSHTPEIRSRHSFLEVMKMPELAAEVTLQPVRRFPLDAAILFADIMTPIEGMGLRLDFDPGPVIDNPVRSAADLDRVRVGDPDETCGFVLETIRGLRSELPTHVPLIGFAGAPFTLFCYIVEGKGSKTFDTARAFLYREPAAADELLGLLARTQVAYLRAQRAAGAQALMVFDSWIGLVGPRLYQERILPHVRHVLEGLRDLGVPRIYFPFGGATLLSTVAGLDADVVGIDWRVPLSSARAALGDGVALQGNLDPSALFAEPRRLETLADEVLDEVAGRPGHIFNLGHGISRHTDPDQVARLVDHVHARTRRMSGTA